MTRQDTVLDMVKTGKTLKRIMQGKGYTVKDIQKHLRLSTPQSVYHWFDGKSLPTIDNLYALSDLFCMPVDMMLTNFVYDKEGVWHKNVMQFRRAFPQNRIISWDDMGHMKQTQYILMHNITYRHDILVKSGLRLPLHTFYVDNIYAYQPLPYCEKFYYMDLNLYHYFIGREDQSVNEKVMLSRIDQQLRVNKLMIDIFTRQNFSGLDKNVRKYMMIYLNKIMTVSSVFLLVGGTSEDLKKKGELCTQTTSCTTGCGRPSLVSA